MSSTKSSSAQPSPVPGPAHPSDAPVFPEILCGVDGTRSSIAAVRLAARLATGGARLTLLAVTSESGSGRSSATAAISPARAKLVLEFAKQIARQAGASPVTILDRHGPPLEVILEHAQAADLLVLGPPPASKFTSLIAASVTARALSRFTTPLLVARRGNHGALQGQSIVVASDGLEDSEPVVELAGRLAAAQHARVTLVHASGTEATVAGRSIQAQAQRLAELLGPDACETRVEPGAAPQVILDAAKATDAAMIAAGSRRRGGVRALGSVSRHLVYEAPCPVLLVPPAAQTSEA